MDTKLPNGINSPDAAARKQSVGACGPTSEHLRGNSAWSSSTKVAYEKESKHSLYRKDSNLDVSQDRSPPVLKPDKSKSKSPRLSSAKSNPSGSFSENSASNGTSNKKGNFEHEKYKRLEQKNRELNQQFKQNERQLKQRDQQIKQKDKENKELRQKVNELEHQLNNTNILIQEENHMLQQQLQETKVNSIQLGEVEMKLKNYGDETNKLHCLSKDSVLLERINELEEQLHQKNQEIQDSLSEQTRQNNQEMQKHMDKLSELISQQMNVKHGKAADIPVATENIMDSHKSSTRIDRTNNQCWRHHDNCLLNEQHFQFVADRLGGEWKRILRLLDIKEYRIDNIEENYHDQSVVEKAVQGLVLWMRQTPEQASLCTLVEALESIDRSDIIAELTIKSPKGLAFEQQELELAVGNKRKMLENLSNDDIREQIGEQMKALEDDKVAENQLYIASVDHYVGREEEIRIIKQFCEESQGNRLIYINGLPGIGKNEVLLNALCQIDRKNVVQPNFYDREDRMLNWTYQEFLQCLTKCWKLAFNKEISNIREELLNVKEPRILILQMACLKGEAIVAHSIWRLIYDITRNNQSKLKVIVTTCKHPEEILIRNVPADQIALRGLDENTSTRLLQMLNPKISHIDGKEITRFFGGNPFLLLKISANIKAFVHFEEDMLDLIKCITNYSLKYDYVNRLVKKTEWSQKMAEVLDIMEENERIVLAKLCVFSGPIPKCLLTYIFGGNETKHEADHLYTYHCILDLVNDGRAYFLSPIYRVFVKMYVKEDKKMYNIESRKVVLQSIYEDAQKQVRNYYIKLLVSLSKMFFSKDIKPNGDRGFDKVVVEYRNNCVVCEKNGCVCNNFHISKTIFGEHKIMILKSLEETLSIDQNDCMPLSPVDIFIFLSYMSKEHTTNFQHCEEDQYKSYEAVDYTATRLYHALLKAACGVNEALDLDFLDKFSRKMQDEASNIWRCETVLFLFYLSRSRFQAFTKINQLEAELDLEKAKSIYSSLSHAKAHMQEHQLVAEYDSRNVRNIYSLPNLACNGKYAYHDVASDVAFHFKKYEHAKDLRKSQLKSAVEQLGEEHPITANAYYQLGKCQEELPKDISLAVGNYEKAQVIYSALKYNDMIEEVSAALKRANEYY